MKSPFYLVLVFMTAFLFSLTGCLEKGNTGATGSTGPQGPQGIPGTVVTVPNTSLPTIAQIVAQQNDYLESQGQDDLQSGLRCNMYTVPTTTTQIVGASLTSVGSFDYLGTFDQSNEAVTEGLNVLPVNLQSTFQSWYILKCTGDLIVADDNWHSFELTSDDGSILYIDGSQYVNNDGLHGVATVSSIPKLLKYGVHTFELDYLQGNGNEALILNEDNSLMNDEGFYH